MARQARTVRPGAWHHLWNRSPQPGGLVRDYADAREFALAITRLTVEAEAMAVWRLRPDGYDLLLRPPSALWLGTVMRDLLTVWGAGLRARHGLTGRLWPDRYRCTPIEDAEAVTTMVARWRGEAMAAGLVRWPWVRLPESGDEAVGVRGEDGTVAG